MTRHLSADWIRTGGWVGATLLTIAISSAHNVACADILFNDFSSTAGLNLVGDAATVSNRLRISPNQAQKVGGAWYTTKQSVVYGFDTTFEFELTGSGTSDGFALLVQNTSDTALFGPGARIGYGGFGSETGGIANSLAVEFDTFGNVENADPNSNHISVHTRGQLSNSSNESFSLGFATPSTPMALSGVHTARIVYGAGSLSVYLDNLLTPLLTVAVDLGSVLNLDNGRALIGFTAASGRGSQNHDLLSWNFTVVPEPTSLALALIAGVLLTARMTRRT